MADFFKTSTTWVVDFRYDGRPRRCFKVCKAGEEVHAKMVTLLHDLYGNHAQLVEVRAATEAEEAQYLRGEEPKNIFCATGRHPPTDQGP